MFISGLLLLGFAFVGGAIWTLRGSGNAALQNGIPKIRFLDIAFQSTPIGAEVYVVGSNEYLGRTPFRRKVEYRDDRTSFVVFRLPGYLETTKEVRPDWTGEITLQPQPVPVQPIPPPVVNPPPAEIPAQPKHPDAKAAEPTKLGRPTHVKAHGKPPVKERDPFDTPVSKDVRKASPFD